MLGSLQNSRGKIPVVKQKSTVEGHASRIEQVEDRISELKDKIEIKKIN
jgi:hypothetical protein